MKKKISTVGIIAVILAATVVVAYAISSLYYTQTSRTQYTKKVIFQFDMDIGMSTGEIGPGDTIPINPIVTNSATEEMYLFMKIQMPEWDGAPLYTFDVDDQWILIESAGDTAVYAYGNPEMIVLYPGESTTALTNQMVMRAISNAEFASIDDLNITFTSYAIGIEDIPSDPVNAWNICKEIGENQ